MIGLKMQIIETKVREFARGKNLRIKTYFEENSWVFRIIGTSIEYERWIHLVELDAFSTVDMAVLLADDIISKMKQIF